MSNYSPINFEVFDYKNDNVLSSYCLPITPLTFIPNLKNFDVLDVLWDFGDDTTSSSLTGIKHYERPGRYQVKLIIYDCFSNTTISTITREVEIFDFLPQSFRINFQNNDNYDNIEWMCGKISGPIYMMTQHPIYNSPIDIFYRVQNSESEYFFNIEEKKYNHLEKTYSFFEKIYNKNLKSFQYSEVDRISIDGIPIYAKIDGNDVVLCEDTDENSLMVGLSGSNTFYFKDDSIGVIGIDLFFDTVDPNSDGLNRLGTSLSASIIENDDIDNLSITSNGLDGEYYPVDSFKINDIKFSGTDISFVVRIKDYEYFSVKNFPPLSSISFSILSSENPNDSKNIIPNEYYQINDIEYFPGSYRGSLYFINNLNIKNVQISSLINITNDQSVSYILSGVTDNFDIFTQNTIKIRKKNEDFDLKETYKNLRFQEFLLEYDTLFEDFLGSVVGDANSSYDTLGKKIYEKITNFIENNQDIDRNEIYSLISSMSMLGNEKNIFSSGSFIYPEKIKRLVDLRSISFNKLLGETNKFKENFNTRGHTSKDFYGINLGDEINTAVYMVSAGTPIVALEKFSNDYSLLNTEQPVELLNVVVYPLSSYHPDWGWPLVLPDDYVYENLNKYYLFFEYISTEDSTIVDNTIFIDENKNNVSNDKMFEVMLMDTLYQTLSIVK